MKYIYKLTWDITAVVAGLYLGWKIFILCGESIPAFGYVPIGIIVGSIGGGLVFNLVHIIDGLISYVIWKMFRIQMYEDKALHFK